MIKKNNQLLITSLLNFLHSAEGLKRLLRHSWISDGRQESVAEHTWRINLMAIILIPHLKIPINLEKVLKMVTIHDLGEIGTGDYHAFDKVPLHKHNQELEALNKLTNDLGKDTKSEIVNLWLEFEQQKTNEARFAQALDKIEVLIQHNEADIKSWDEVEYDFNLSYGNNQSEFDAFIKEFRNLVREETVEKIKKNKQ